MSTVTRAVREAITRGASRGTSARIATMTGVLRLREAGMISTRPCASHLSAPDQDSASAMAKVAARKTMSSMIRLKGLCSRERRNAREQEGESAGQRYQRQAQPMYWDSYPHHHGH